ncbi:MAG: MFS transporter [Elusimicrobia bacterium]|nr:MFS transporter [Elusimicrobiota bacterium]
MIFSRALSILLAALTVIFSPGPQVWAQTASIGPSGSGKPIQAAPIVSQISFGWQYAADRSLSLGPLTLAVLPQTAIITPSAIARPKALSAQAPAQPLLKGAQIVRRGFYGSGLRDHAPTLLIGRNSPAPKPAKAAALHEKTAALSEQAAPLVNSIASPEASPDSLRRGGYSLQSLLEGQKAPEAVPSDLQPAEQNAVNLGRLSRLNRPESSNSGDAGQPTPAPAPELSPQQKSRFRFYAVGVSIVKTGLDALNLAVPLLMLDAFHAAMAVSTLYLSAELARLVTGFVGGAIVDRIGAGRTMALTAALQMAATLALPFVFASGAALALPAVYAAFILNGLGYELFDVARRAALPQIVGRNEGALRVYNGRLYVWREIAATAGVFGAGAVVSALGAMTSIWIHPAFCLAVAFTALRLWNLRPKEDEAEGEAPGASKGWRESLNAWYADTVKGMKHVFSNPRLRSLVFINIPLTAVHKIFHTLVAVVYATQVLRNPAMAAVLIGAWNLGELAGAFYLDRFGKTSRFSTWLRLAAGASLSMWLYRLIPSAWVAIPVSFLIAAAMIGNELGAVAYMQSNIPEKDLGSVTGFVYGFSRAISMLTLLAAGWAFDALSAMGGFLSLAVIFTLLAPVYLFAAKRFSGERVPGGASAQDD